MKKESIAVFLIISFVIAYPVFYLSTRQTSPAVITLFLLIGSYAPALGALIALRNENEVENQLFRKRLRGWGSVRWIGFSLIVPSIIWISAFAVISLQGKTGQYVWLALAVLPVILVVNYGEEIGWRGYALPKLMKRFTPLNSSLLLGVIWVLFHAPLYIHKPIFGLTVSLIIILISIILTWIFQNTQIILPGTLFHAMFNAWTQVFVTDGAGESILVVVIILLFVFVGGLIYRYAKNLLIPV